MSHFRHETNRILKEKCLTHCIHILSPPQFITYLQLQYKIVNKKDMSIFKQSLVVQSIFPITQNCWPVRIIGSCTVNEADTQNETTKQPSFMVQPCCIYSREHGLSPSTLATCSPTEKEMFTVRSRSLGFGSDPAEKQGQRSVR